jgi:hypothetical protein
MAWQNKTVRGKHIPSYLGQLSQTLDGRNSWSNYRATAGVFFDVLVDAALEFNNQSSTGQAMKMVL